MLDMAKVNEALKRTDEKLGALDKTKYQQLSSAMASLTPREIVQYQEIKSIAQMENRIDLEVAMWIYRTVGHWATSPIADKVVLLEVMRALCGKR